MRGLQLVAVAACWWLCSVQGLEVHTLEASAFDLTLANSKYAAVLFYDKSSAGSALMRNWEAAARLLDALHDDATMVQVDGTDPELKELIDAYNIAVPSIRVFRRSVMGDYRGPSQGSSPTLPQEMADYIKEDAMPSVKLLSTTEEIRHALASSSSSSSSSSAKRPSTTVIGIFSERDLEEESGDSYSVSSWGQFQAAADSLRGHSSFFASSSSEIVSSFRLGDKDLPAVYLIGEDRDKIIPFSGDILEQGLAEWVLRHSTPSTGELTLTTPAGELYATQFFSSRRLKFILFLRASDVRGGGGSSSSSEEEEEGEGEGGGGGKGAMAGTSAVLRDWHAVADAFKGTALFAYMVDGAVSDVAGYFELDVSSDVPMIVAHDPAQDSRFKSPPLRSLSRESLQAFVSGVVQGGVSKMLKSEPLPKAGRGIKSSVVHAVGSTVLGIVGEAGKDVLLEVYSPRCANCKKLAPTFDILAKAVAGEPRIVIAKIDGVNNDLPSSWGVRTYPTLLWFPARDKPYGDAQPVPRAYWDAGTSLHDLMSFVQRKGSFELASLRVATNEQLGTLLGDEDKIRAQYDELDRVERRNEGRQVYENAALDWVHGEIIYDGKRWHVGAAAVLALYALAATVYFIGGRSNSNNNSNSNSNSKRVVKND